MKLNRTGSNWTELERNKINENWRIIEGNYNDVVDKVSEEAFKKVVDSAKLNWKEPVDSFADLPSAASEGDTRMTRDSGKVYRFNGEMWQEIQQIDAGPVNEVDRRLTAQLAETDRARRYESMINRKEPDGLYITWTDDDGWSEVYDRMKPLMVDYGIPMTSAIIPDRVLNSTSGRYLTPEQVKELSDLGMEFLSHTNSSSSSDRPIDWPEERLDEDFRLSQQQVAQLGGNPRGLVLPYADNSPLIQKVARRYFDFVVGTGAASRPEAGKVLYPGEIDNYYITRVTVERGFDYVKQRLDEGAANGVAWINFVSHIYGDWYSDEYCRQIIEYAQSLGYKFITNQEGVERFGNIAQFGDIKIGANGVINGELGRVHYKPRTDGINHETPITDFPQNVITFTDINTPNATNFPGGLPGVLYTHRYNVTAYSRQVYVTSRSYKVFTRTWNINDKEWNEWTNTDTVQYLGINAIGLNDSPILFKLQNKISYTQIDSRGNEGFPENKSGLLINYAHEFGTTFPYQEYQLFREPRTFRRYWVNSSWTKWQEIGGTSTLPLNSVNGLTPPSDFDLGITKTWINSNGDRAGLPDSRSGTLITYKQSNSSIGFNYQEFVAYQSWDKYIRYATSSGWSDWKKFVVE